MSYICFWLNSSKLTYLVRNTCDWHKIPFFMIVTNFTGQKHFGVRIIFFFFGIVRNVIVINIFIIFCSLPRSSYLWNPVCSINGEGIQGLRFQYNNASGILLGLPRYSVHQECLPTRTVGFNTILWNKIASMLRWVRGRDILKVIIQNPRSTKLASRDCSRYMN